MLFRSAVGTFSRCPRLFANKRGQRLKVPTALYEVVRDNIETLYGAMADVPSQNH